MTMPMEVLAAEALALPPAERSELLNRLLASLDAGPPNAEWEQAWSAEVDRREAAIAAGQSRWVPRDEVIAGLRSRLG